MTPIQEILADFDLMWGIAPPDSLKGRRGEEVKAFLRSSLLRLAESYEDKLEEALEGWDANFGCTRSEFETGRNGAKFDEEQARINAAKDWLEQVRKELNQ